MILNEIANCINETYSGQKRFKSQIKRRRIRQLSLCQFFLSGLFRLGGLASGFFDLQFRTSCKICFKPIMRPLSLCTVLVDVLLQFNLESSQLTVHCSYTAVQSFQKYSTLVLLQIHQHSQHCLLLPKFYGCLFSFKSFFFY